MRRIVLFIVFFFKQKTAYEIKECDWSSDVCSSDLDDFKIINAILKNRSSIKLIRSRNIDEALKIIEQFDFDIILLEYLLPDGNGFDFLKLMDKKDMEIPAIIITKEGNEMIASQIIQAGAYDYLPKEVVSDESLCQSISIVLEKSRTKKEIKAAQKKMAEMSIKDGLTGLYNRRYFMESIEKEVARAFRHKLNFRLCMIDVDYFKDINDTYGHQTGDMVLSEFGKLLRQYFRKNDTICRYGGDEFAVIMPHISAHESMLAAERFREEVASHIFKYDSIQFSITVSIGISFYTNDKNQSSTELVELADKALYKAKIEGRNRVNMID